MKDMLVDIAFWIGITAVTAILSILGFVCLGGIVFTIIMGLSIIGFLMLIIAAVLPPLIPKQEEEKTNDGDYTPSKNEKPKVFKRTWFGNYVGILPVIVIIKNAINVPSIKKYPNKGHQHSLHNSKSRVNLFLRRIFHLDYEYKDCQKRCQQKPSRTQSSVISRSLTLWRFIQKQNC